MTRPGMLLLSCLLLLAVVTASSASAAGGPRILVLGPAADHPTVSRVRDELTLLGFEVEVESPAGARSLGEAAAAAGAAAAVRVEHWPPEILLWVRPPGVAGDSAEPIKVSDSLTDEAEPTLLALRAVELLRGKLLPVPAGAKPQPQPAPAAAPPKPVPVPPAGPPPAPLSPPPDKAPAPAGGAPSFAPDASAADQNGAGGRLSLYAAPSLLLSPGGVPPAPVIRLGGRYRIAWRLNGELLALVPTVAADVTGEQPGTVALRALTLGAGATISLTEPDSAVRASAGLGVAAVALWFAGEAEPPLEAASGSRWVAAPYAVAAAGYRFTRHIGLRAELLGALLRPEPILRIAGREVASFGQPAVFASLGLEVLP